MLRADRPPLGRRRVLHPGNLARTWRRVSPAQRARQHREQPASALSARARGALQVVLRTSDPVAVGHALRLDAALVSAPTRWRSSCCSPPTSRAPMQSPRRPRRLPPQYVVFFRFAVCRDVLRPVHGPVLHPPAHRKGPACFLLSGLCAVLAYEARTAGIALLAAWVAESLLRRDSTSGRRSRPSFQSCRSWPGWAGSRRWSLARVSAARVRLPTGALRVLQRELCQEHDARGSVDAELGPSTSGCFSTGSGRTSKLCP